MGETLIRPCGLWFYLLRFCALDENIEVIPIFDSAICNLAPTVIPGSILRRTIQRTCSIMESSQTSNDDVGLEQFQGVLMPM